MRIAKRGQILIAQGKIAQIPHDMAEFSLHQRQRFFHDEHIGVVTDIAGGGAQMNDGAGFGAGVSECVNVRHHIVAELFLVGGGLFVVHFIGVRLHFLNLLIGNRQAGALFGFGQGNPESVPGAEFFVCREEILHFGRGIPGGEGRDITAVFHVGVPFVRENHIFYPDFAIE